MCQSRADSDLPGITFQAVARARKQLMLTELAERGLGDLGNPVLLFLLKEREGQVSSQRELSDAMRISPASVAVSLKSLERGGYVEKLSDEKDQRRKAVRLTDKGRAALETCFSIFQGVDRRMLDGFTPEEMEQVRAFHLRMLRNLRNSLPAERMDCSC